MTNNINNSYNLIIKCIMNFLVIAKFKKNIDIIKCFTYI